MTGLDSTWSKSSTLRLRRVFAGEKCMSTCVLLKVAQLAHLSVMLLANMFETAMYHTSSAHPRVTSNMHLGVFSATTA